MASVVYRYLHPPLLSPPPRCSVVLDPLIPLGTLSFLYQVCTRWDGAGAVPYEGCIVVRGVFFDVFVA